MNRKTEHFLGACFMYAVIVLALVFFFLAGESAFEKRNPIWGAIVRFGVGIHLLGDGVFLLIIACAHLPLYIWLPSGIVGLLMFVMGTYTLLNFTTSRRKKCNN